MTRKDQIALLILGFLFWSLGTLYYAYRGDRALAETALLSWINFVLSPVATAALCVVILEMRHVPASAWASGMLLLALPGMFGEVVVLSHLATLMPKIPLSAGGRFGASLFAAYALMLGIGEAISLSARP